MLHSLRDTIWEQGRKAVAFVDSLLPTVDVLHPSLNGLWVGIRGNNVYLIGGIHHTRLRQVSYPGVTGANRTSGDRMCLPLVSLGGSHVT